MRFKVGDDVVIRVVSADHKGKIIAINMDDYIIALDNNEELGYPYIYWRGNCTGYILSRDDDDDYIRLVSDMESK